jgi:hypothetical protein
MKTTETIINVEEALVQDAILLLMVTIRVARVIGWWGPEEG